ncbi:MAG: hypothetical protein K6T62_00005, partial [Alicyclobacillus sp.]|nr:hypothetical protein [Alicyclobacillus sp.]
AATRSSPAAAEAIDRGCDHGTSFVAWRSLPDVVTVSFDNDPEISFWKLIQRLLGHAPSDV